MTRWLQAARGAIPAADKTDKRDKTPLEANSDPVLSDLSVLSGMVKPSEATPDNSTRASFAPSKPSKLPSAPRTCAICGVADWQVSVKEPDGRFAHVLCLPQFRPAMGGTPDKMPPEGRVAMQPDGALGLTAAADLEAKP